MTLAALCYRQAAQLKSCVDTIVCEKSDELYYAHLILVGLANYYTYLCEDDTATGCTRLTSRAEVLHVLTYTALAFLPQNCVACVQILYGVIVTFKKADIALPGESPGTLELDLRDVTCHMGSHSVTATRHK